LVQALAALALIGGRLRIIEPVPENCTETVRVPIVPSQLLDRTTAKDPRSSLMTQFILSSEFAGVKSLFQIATKSQQKPSERYCSAPAPTNVQPSTFALQGVQWQPCRSATNRPLTTDHWPRPLTTACLFASMSDVVCIAWSPRLIYTWFIPCRSVSVKLSAPQDKRNARTLPFRHF